MFDHPRIDVLDLRFPGKRLIANIRRVRADIRAFQLAYRRSQEWIDWDEEISWPWTITTDRDWNRRRIRRGMPITGLSLRRLR